jgi:hypothetical protein
LKLKEFQKLQALLSQSRRDALRKRRVAIWPGSVPDARKLFIIHKI